MCIRDRLTVFGALLGALRFPLSQRYMEKLNRFLRLRQEGEENPALERQLEKVVVNPHRQPFFVNGVKAFLRPLDVYKRQTMNRIPYSKAGCQVIWAFFVMDSTCIQKRTPPWKQQGASV